MGNLGKRNWLTAMRWGLSFGICLILWVTFAPQPLVAQQSAIPLTDRLSDLASPVLDTFNSRIETRWVMLDGRRILLVAAPSLAGDAGQESDISPVDERMREIERRLKDIARDVVEGEVSAEVMVSPSDSDPSLYTIAVEDRYLMTVTPWDVQASGSGNLEGVVDTTVENIREALKRAVLERSPAYVRKAIVNSLGIVAGVALLCWLLSRLRTIAGDYFANQLQGFAEAVPLPTPVSTLEESWPQEIDNEREVEQAAAQQEWNAQKNRLRLRQDFLSLLLQILQIVLIVIGSAVILNLFPQTRYIKTNALAWFTETALEVLLVGIGTYLIFRLSLVAIDRLFTSLSYGRIFQGGTSTRLTRRLKTFSGVLKSLVGAIVISIGILLFLSAIRINVGPILAGAGLIGLAVSFASQSLVKDIINGFFILLEDQFSEGDVIVTGDYAGVVEDLNLRVTRLRSADGNLIVVPNSAISVVENLTNGFSRSNLGIEVAYDTDLDFAIATIQNVAEEMAEHPDWKPAIVSPPQVLGVDSFGDNSITIRLWIDTQPLKQWDVGREFRRRLKYAFDRCNISIPFPQRSIWFETPLHSLNRQVSESELKQLIEQRGLSHGDRE